MWRVVDRTVGGGCLHHRGRISTVKTRRFKFGKVTVADNRCGNGQFVLRRVRKSGRQWHIVGAGSDWGDPARCNDDLKRIPRTVLQDLFHRGICRSARVVVARDRRCGTFRSPQNRYRIHVHAEHVSCKTARKVIKEWWNGKPSNQFQLPPYPDGSEGDTKLKRFPGWRCQAGAGGGACRKHKAIASYQSGPFAARGA